MRTRLALLLLVCLLLLPTPAGAQGDDINALTDRVVEYLGIQIGYPLTRNDVADLSWSEFTWEDTALGCPQVGVAYAQQMTRGYIFNIEFGSARYELHALPDGSRIVLCNTEFLAPTPAPAATEAQQAAPTTPPPAVASPTTAGAAPAAATPTTGGAAPAAATPTTGGAAPAAATATTPPPAQPTNTLAPTLTPTSTGGGAVPSAAVPPDAPTASLLYTGTDGNVYLSTLAGLPGQAVTSGVQRFQQEGSFRYLYSNDYGNFRWSSSGFFAALTDNNDSPRLLLTDFQGTTPAILFENIAPGYPPAWNTSDDQIAVVVPTDSVTEEGQFMSIYTVARPLTASTEPDTEPRIVGSIFQEGRCDSTFITDPANAAYFRETSIDGNDLAFRWMPDDTFIYTVNCNGSGLARFDPNTGAETVIDPSVVRPVFSPDNRNAVGIVLDTQPPRLVQINLDENTRETVNLDFTPDQVWWSKDGLSLFISALEPIETVEVPFFGGETTRYNVSLWQVQFLSGDTSLLFQEEGRGIGSLTEAPDNSGIVFTFIQSPDALIEAMQAGGSPETAYDLAPVPQIIYLAPDGTTYSLGESYRPAFQPTAIDAGGAG